MGSRVKVKDDTRITVKWNPQTSMYQAKVDHKGKTSTFALPDASNEIDARNQANKVMSDYKRETGGNKSSRCPQCGCKRGEHIIDCPNNPRRGEY